MEDCFCSTCGRLKIEKRLLCDRTLALDGRVLSYCGRLTIDTAIGPESYCVTVTMDPDSQDETAYWARIACRHCPGDPVRPVSGLINHAKLYCPVTKFPKKEEPDVGK